MPASAVPIIQIDGVEKRYRGVRPLRLQSLTLAPAERLAVVGVDGPGAEVLVNLVTGASVPDSGVVRVLGHNSADISTGDEWLASLDRFGMVSPRAVLLEGATVEQNLAMPFTLQIDPIEPALAARVATLARECGLLKGDAGSDLEKPSLQRQAGTLSPTERALVHLGRAIALDPALLILEHPTAEVPEADRTAFAAIVVRVTEARRLATLVLTQDQPFAQLVCHRTMKLNAATGVLTRVRQGWFK